MNGPTDPFGLKLLATWKELGLNQRVSIVVAGLALVAGLVGVGLWSARTEYTQLFGRLDEAESAKVVAALNDAKVPFTINRAGGGIMVPADKVHLMRWQLASKGIGRNSAGVGFEIFDKPAFGISDFVQRANYLRAIKGELERTLAQVSGIESAQVMIVMPENRLLVDRLKRPTASVMVNTPGMTLPPQTVNAIRFLIANSVEGLQPNAVAVVDNSGNVLSENSEENSITGLTTSQLTARRELEQYFTKKAEGMLEKVLGPGQAVVRVAAEINFDSLVRTEEKYDPEGQVLRSSINNDENTDSLVTTPSSAGAGLSANIGETNSATSLNSTNQTNTKKKVINNQYEINKTTVSTTLGAGGLKRLTAAVFVAARFTGTGTNRVATPRTPAELDKLRKIVQSAIGIQEGADTTRADTVTLEEMAFNDQPALELSQRLESQEKKQFWINLALKLTYPALGLAVLGLFWRSLKKTAADSIPLGVPIGQLDLDGNPNGRGTVPEKGSEHRRGDVETLIPGVVTVDVLNQLIRENPSNMAEAVRSWMDRGKSN